MIARRFGLLLTWAALLWLSAYYDLRLVAFWGISSDQFWPTVCRAHPVLQLFICWYAIVFGLVGLALRPSARLGLAFAGLIFLEPLLYVGCAMVTGRAGELGLY